MTDTLHLDKRQRAMLAEMGVRVWSPMSEAAVMGAPVVEALAVDTSASQPPEVVMQAHADEAHSFVAASALVTQAIPNPTKPAPVLIQRPEGIDQMDWSALHNTVSGCQACSLCGSRKNTVFGVGAPAAEGQAPQVDWLIVGEAPGADEDEQGLPFVGRAGQLLTKIIEAMGMTRREVFICNVLKCRPPNNRPPAPGEVTNCRPYLKRQLEIIRPKVIVALGNHAAKALLQTEQGISGLRGTFQEYEGIPVMCTYHPAYLLRSPGEKRKVWEDMKKVMQFLERSGE